MYYNTKASGARIRELRIAKNFTQDDLAEHMNVSNGYISFIESGKRGCSVDVLIALSNLFGVSGGNVQALEQARIRRERQRMLSAHICQKKA